MAEAATQPASGRGPAHASSIRLCPASLCDPHALPHTARPPARRTHARPRPRPRPRAGGPPQDPAGARSSVCRRGVAHLRNFIFWGAAARRLPRAQCVGASSSKSVRIAPPPSLPISAFINSVNYMLEEYSLYVAHLCFPDMFSGSER
ncbi:hypothetical protein HYPSUDRAFT_216170 [Hypholoma sublateritium FD-334 SS-4]|uniref:Uncharacterized protein n=1 Tax=Hypholoma sublateritium (strain FD-334 SS-4) TaxID=945553 RepID=A0A0D2PNZ7_HYPSF|nr:hypothetical protein HYPSUDRAFT_216170 [Hypholoma sublateritium FD-334 SS-4]